MESGCCIQCHAAKMTLFGALLVLARIYLPDWDPWVIVGALIIFKGLVMMAKPNCCHTEAKAAVKSPAKKK